MPNDEKLRQYLKRVTVDLHDARRRLREVVGHSQQPIAIVGMSCRLPGDVSSPEQLWDLVSAGSEGISGFPADRGWGSGIFESVLNGVDVTIAREGGFVHDAGEFDAAFFRISPREALTMDPQQRLMLEASWEAFEDADISPASLKGSPTGVFVGVSPQLYGVGQTVTAGGGYNTTGGTGSVVSGRVS